MKKFILFSLFFINLLPFLAGSQNSLEIEYKKVGNNFTSCPVILPSMNNLITLVDGSIDDFKKLMNKYKYYPKENYVGTDFCYTNMGIDLFMYGNDGKGVNIYTYYPEVNVVECEIMVERMWPAGYVAEWHSNMSSYFTKQEGLLKYYLYETSDFYYVFILQTDENATRVWFGVRKISK